MNPEGTTKDNGSVERLRMILQAQRGCLVTPQEAAEIGESLIAFYEMLGEGAAGADDNSGITEQNVGRQTWMSLQMQ